MGSDSDDEERPAYKSSKNEEPVTKENVVDGKVGESRKKRIKRSSSDSHKPVVEGNKTPDGEPRKKRAKRSSSDSQKHTVDANSSNTEVKEASQINSNNGTQQSRKRKSKTSSESEEGEEKAENSSSPIKKLSVSSENKPSVREDVEAKWKRAAIVDPKVKIPMFTDPALPFGWHRECIQRKTGKTEGLYDVYIFSPAGKKFRSRVELAKFLAATDSTLDPEEFDFSVYGRRGYASNSATRKKIKAILEMNNSSSVATPEKKEAGIKSSTPKPDKQSDPGEAKRTSVKRGRKPKDKTVLPQPQKKARLKFTPTLKEIFKGATQNSFCLDCGKEDCKYPYVVLENPPRRLDLLVKEGIKYR